MTKKFIGSGRITALTTDPIFGTMATTRFGEFALGPNGEFHVGSVVDVFEAITPMGPMLFMVEHTD